MKALRALCSAALACIYTAATFASSSPAHTVSAPVVRTLFVGIDTYPPGAQANLRGAVNDVLALRSQLAASHGLDVGPVPSTTSCESTTARSISLVNGCATRARILGSFDALVRASAKGDTLVFYFAGHGAQDSGIANAKGDRTQPSGRNTSLVAADSRDTLPDGSLVGDILDVELKARIDEASAHGIQVVTLFDSCNSGSATRGLGVASRSLPPLADAERQRTAEQASAAWQPRPAPPGVAPVLPIHIGAARDGERALEAGEGPDRHGVFTKALLDALATSRNADGIYTYADLLVDIRRAIARTPPGQSGEQQEPQGYGPLQSTPVQGATVPGNGRIFPAVADAQGIRLADGRLSGVAEGSVFAIYRSSGDALRSRGSLGLAPVREVEGARALLASLPGLRPKEALFAVERVRSWGELSIPVAFEGIPRAHVKAGLAEIEILRQVSPAQARYVVQREGDRIALFDASGERRVDISAIAGANDGIRLNEALRRVANAEALLRLPSRAEGPMARLEIVALDCPGCAPLADTAAAQPGRLKLGDRFRIRISRPDDADDQPIFPYLFEVSPQFGITRLYPPLNASDILDKTFFVGGSARAARPGDFRLVLIASRSPIGVGPLEQGSLPRAGCADGNALAQLLCAAAAGTRASSARPTGDFDAIVLPMLITKGDS